MAEDYRSIDTVPRDGTVVEVMDPDCGSFLMRWNPAGFNPLVSRSPGIWECIEGTCTWCEDEGAGPTLWRPTAPSDRQGGGGG